MKTIAMRKRILTILFLAAIPLFFSQCKKIIESIKVNVPVSMEEDFTIPVIEDTDNALSIAFTTEADINSLISEQNSSLGIDNIRSVKIKGVSVHLANDQQDEVNNLSALESMSLYLSSDNHPNEVLIAHTTSVSDPFYAELSTEDTDLKDYFTGNTFHFRVELKGAHTTTQEIEASSKMEFTVTAGL